MINWLDVGDSQRVSAVAYDAEQEIIYVRFKVGGAEWWYGSCPPHIWEQFTAPGVSKGRFIKDVLDDHQKGRHFG
ncbi:MAG TPA: KTSC domain-containing protein [Thermoanaerobaculia bacterium]|nr:KTSC domain-containing protein [Thermoanaerobaculia bacterium]